jgi:hypothetical protein
MLKKHFQKPFMEVGEVGTTIAAVKFYLAQDL